MPATKPADVVSVLDETAIRNAPVVSLSRPVSGGLGRMETIPAPKGDYGSEIRIWGETEIRNGPGKCLVAGCGCAESHVKARNKIVGQGLRSIVNAIAVNPGSSGLTNSTVMTTFAKSSGEASAGGLTSSYILVGTGGGATGDSTTTLTTQNTTKPNTTDRVLSNPSAGVYRLSYTATWNSGTLPAITISEYGVFGNLVATLGNEYDSGTQVAATMFARVSAADSEFTAFALNTAAPLVIEWRIVLTFT